MMRWALGLQTASFQSAIIIILYDGMKRRDSWKTNDTCEVMGCGSRLLEYSTRSSADTGNAAESTYF